MKATLKFFALTSLMAISALFYPSLNTITPWANNQVSVKLVLGDHATLQGYQGVNDEEIYHRNVVTYTAAIDSTLPRPTKPNTTFVSWVFAQSSTLVRINKMPRTSGAVYYAYWQGDGTLATTIPTSSSSSSSSASSSSITSSPSLPPSSSSSSSLVTSTSVSSSSVESSSSSEAFVPFNLYLQANTANVNWTEDNAQIRLFFWNAPVSLAWPGSIMTSEGNGLYRYRFESFAPTNLLFTRVNPNDATEVWNQTVDLTYVTSQHLFTLTSWNNGEGKSTGTWSAYTPSTSSSVGSSSTPITSSEIITSSSESSIVSSSASSSTPSSSITSSAPTSSSLPSSSVVSSVIHASSETSSLVSSSASSTTPSSVVGSSSTPSSLVDSSSMPSSSVTSSSLSSIIHSSSETSSLVSSSASSTTPSSSITSSAPISSSLPSSSVLPVQFDVYLKVNDPIANWGLGSATFKLHYWGNGQNSDWNQLPSLTDIGNGVYHYAFYDYQPTHMLFQRRSADGTVIWNMTIDYAYPGDDALLTITSWSSLEYCGDCLDQGTKSTGVWSTYSPA